MIGILFVVAMIIFTVILVNCTQPTEEDKAQSAINAAIRNQHYIQEMEQKMAQTPEVRIEEYDDKLSLQNTFNIRSEK